MKQTGIGPEVDVYKLYRKNPIQSTLLWVVCHANIPSFTVDLSRAEYLTPASDSEACYDASGDGEHCICGYNPSDGNAGCCTGTLQIDMGGGITGNFDYVGWDDEYNKPYYRTKACLRSQLEQIPQQNTGVIVLSKYPVYNFRIYFSSK